MSTLALKNAETFFGHGDPVTSEFLGMDSPWTFSVIGLNIFALTWFVLPNYMRNRKPMDTRPLIVVVNGIGFGACACGLVAMALGTDAIRKCVDCNSYKPDTDDLDDLIVKYVAYCVLIFKLFEMSKSVLNVLAKRDRDVSTLALMQLQAALVFAWYGVKLNPGGFFILFGLLDGVYLTLLYGYSVSTCCSNDVKIGQTKRHKLKLTLHLFRLASVLFTIAFTTRFLIAGNCPNPGFMLLSVIYLSIYCVLYPVELAIRYNAKSLTQLLEVVGRSPASTQ